MQQDKSTVALALVGVLALTIIGIVVGEIMNAPVTDLSLVATAIAGGLIGWLAPNLRRNDKPVEVEVTPAPVKTGGPNPARHQQAVAGHTPTKPAKPGGYLDA